MGLFKRTGKTVRLGKSLEPIMARLRQALERTQPDDDRQVKPDVQDEDVIAFGLWLASLMVQPKYALVDRDEYAGRVDRELVMGMGMSSFASRPEHERKAALDLILARSATFSAFHSSSPLMAVPPAGERPS